MHRRYCFNCKISNHWLIGDVLDTTNDGRADMFWRNDTSKQLYLWEMNGPSVVSVSSPKVVAGLNWDIAP